MDTVVLLWHIHEMPDGDDEKLIGVYRTGEDASAAIERLRDKPGFKELPDSFKYYTCVLNMDGWTGGYVTGEEGLIFGG
jgi:hypothetical protein